MAMGLKERIRQWRASYDAWQSGHSALLWRVGCYLLAVLVLAFVIFF